VRASHDTSCGDVDKQSGKAGRLREPSNTAQGWLNSPK